MEKTLDTISTSESPFFELLAGAQEIRIREICPDNREKIAGQLERSLSELPPSGETHRTFFVRIRAKPPEPPPKALEEGPSPENRNYLLRSAELLVDEGDFVLARNIYSYLLKSNLRDPEPMKGLGLCFAKLGDATSARKCFRALLELDGNAETHFWIGQCDILENNDEAALASFKKIERPSDLKTEIQFELFKEWGNCANRRGSYDEAWSSYHKALALNPNWDIIYVNLGTLEIQRQHPEVAYSYFSKAVELNPKSSRGHCGLGLVATARGDVTGAMRAFEAALDLDPQNLMALYQLLTACEGRDEMGHVRGRLETYLAKHPKNVDLQYALAFLYYRSSDWMACRRQVEQILTLDANHSRARALRDELDRNKHLP